MKIDKREEVRQNTQHLYQLIELCVQSGIKQAVVSPGSRCAPLLVGLSLSEIETVSVPDERCAGYIALGIAQQIQKPVIVVCTSGTAVLNLYPAITEAYYQQVPLVILTADRPEEWIDQWDGQTIRQGNVFRQHIFSSMNYQADEQLGKAGKLLEMGRRLRSPVHLNLPIKEPFYFDTPLKIDLYSLELKQKVNKVWSQVEKELYKPLSSRLADRLPDSKVDIETIMAKYLPVMQAAEHVVILGGQEVYDEELVMVLNEMSKEKNLVILGDIISNLSGVKSLVLRNDLVFHPKVGQVSLPPVDLLITFGRSIISKSLKLFLRKHEIKEHWHLSTELADPKIKVEARNEAGSDDGIPDQNKLTVGDPFRSLTRVISVSARDFFNYINRSSLSSCFPGLHPKIANEIRSASKRAEDHYREVMLQNDFSDTGQGSNFFRLVEVYLKSLIKSLRKIPGSIELHLANSMPVRIANLVSNPVSPVSLVSDMAIDSKNIENGNMRVWSNRGTSGIDGVVSTAVGQAIADPEHRHSLIVGDISFFYDRNALWLNHTFPNNLQIVVLNDHGGGIFRMIDGPESQGESILSLLTTPHRRTMENTANEFQLPYFQVNSIKELFELSEKGYAERKRETERGLEDRIWQKNQQTELLKRDEKEVLGVPSLGVPSLHSSLDSSLGVWFPGILEIRCTMDDNKAVFHRLLNK